MSNSAGATVLQQITDKKFEMIKSFDTYINHMKEEGFFDSSLPDSEHSREIMVESGDPEAIVELIDKSRQATCELLQIAIQGVPRHDMRVAVLILKDMVESLDAPSEEG